MVDMSATLLHHGHIRLLKKASKFGDVVVGLTKDDQVKKQKGYNPEIKFKFRKEILEAIKYVKKVIPSKFFIDDKYLRKNKIDLLVHGSDNRNEINSIKIKTFKRTKGISSSLIRKKIIKILQK